MAQNLNLSTEENAALDRIDAELAGTSVSARAGAKAEALDIGDLCKKYQAIRSSLEILVKIVKKIPGIGGKIGAALEFLMSLADIACPV
jgi:hypothetical protein